MHISRSTKLMATCLLLAATCAFAQKEDVSLGIPNTWNLPDGQVGTGPGTPKDPQDGPVNFLVTFAEVEIPQETSIDGAVINSLDGTVINPLSFSFTSTDAIFTSVIGPPVLTLSTFPWIEGDSAGTMTIDFGADVTSVSADFTLSTVGLVPDASTVTAYDSLGNVVGTTSAACDDLGNIFCEGSISFSGAPFRYVEFTYDSGSAARFLFDNLSYNLAAQVPTLGETALMALVVLLAGAAIYMRRRNAA